MGMPFAGRNDTVLESQGKESCNGQQLYVNLCMRAVSHSIGRSFRNVNDDTAVVLFDDRDGEYAKLLPEWILRSFEKVRKRRTVTDRIDQFFRRRNGTHI
jgi:Rad3-related DNA helicase